MSATVAVGHRGPRRRRLTPWTAPHFYEYASRLVFDDGERHPPEPWELDYARDVLRGAAVAREAWLLVPEGNSKTTGVARLALYGADFCWRPWIPVGAASRDQAKILYRQAAGFVRDTPGMEGNRFKCLDGYRVIRSVRNGGEGILVCPWDPATNDGTIPWPFAIVDEPHRHPDMSLYRLWKGKLRKRGAQILALSTAGEPGSEFEDTRDRIRDRAKTRRRRHGGTRYAGNRTVMHEYMLERVEDCMDPQKVARVNPLSVITAEMLAEDLDSPTFDLGDWKRLKCNVPARSALAAITDEEWDGAEVDAEVPEGERIDVGYDVAWKWDTAALTPLWRGPDYNLLGPPNVLVPPRDGSAMHPDEVKRAFERMGARNPVDAVVMDTNDAEDVAAWLEDEFGVQVVDRGQTNPHHVLDYNNFTRCLRATERSVGKDGTRTVPLRHTGDKLLRRHVMNAVVRRLPGDQKRFDRPATSRNSRKQDVRVVDALTAAGMVCTFALEEAVSLAPAIAVARR